MWWKKIRFFILLTSFLTVCGCMEIPEHSVCASGLICPPHLQCDDARDICITDSTDTRMLALGGSHTCALSDDGAVRCWGGGVDGQLGHGNLGSIGDNERPALRDVEVGGSVIQIAAGAYHTCALLDTGAVRCWGKGANGQLGYGDLEIIGDNETPASADSVAVGRPVTRLAAGAYHTCALLDTGAVRCWGAGFAGRLGYGDSTNIGDNELPASAGDVAVGGKVIQITAGGAHTCALLDTGAVRCWGAGSSGQLGYGNTNDIGDNEPPASAGDVAVGGKVIQITAGGVHTCALLDTGAVRCWGTGSFGRLGYGNTNSIGTPVTAGNVDVGGTVTQIAAGGEHTCALLDSGSVRCWGRGDQGQLGYAHTNSIGDDEPPAWAGDVNVGGTVTQIAAGGEHTCALLDWGAIRCWGQGYYGQLGYGNTNDVGDDETPASVGNVEFGGSIISGTASLEHAGALPDASSAQCWSDELSELELVPTRNSLLIP